MAGVYWSRRPITRRAASAAEPRPRKLRTRRWDGIALSRGHGKTSDSACHTRDWIIATDSQGACASSSVRHDTTSFGFSLTRDIALSLAGSHPHAPSSRMLRALSPSFSAGFCLRHTSRGAKTRLARSAGVRVDQMFGWILESRDRKEGLDLFVRCLGRVLHRKMSEFVKLQHLSIDWLK